MFTPPETANFSTEPEQIDYLALDEVSVLRGGSFWNREIVKSRDFALIYALFLG